MFKNHKKLTIKLWILVFLSSVLLSIPFMLPHLGLVALVGFIPLLAAEHLAREQGKKHFFILSYASFFLWNLITTYWVWFATPPGAAAAILLNSLQMAVIFALFRWMRGIAKGFLPYLFLIFTWLAWEHCYFTWAVNWPWLVLGNAFATSVKSIQWYEYTGHLGGSFWVLLVNVLAFRIICLRLKGERVVASAASLATVVLLPILLSHVIYYRYEEKPRPRHFTVLQPNIDPYNEKFGGLTQQEQDQILENLIRNSVTVPGRMILAPETFISSGIIEDFPQRSQSFNRFYRLLESYNVPTDSLNRPMGSLPPRGENTFILGAVTSRIYDTPVAPTETARPAGQGRWYDTFNTAIFLNASGGYEFYHKSKLVILAESNPFAKGPLKFIDKLVSGMVGGIGNFGTQPERSIFMAPDSVKIGTAICYESIFGDYYREYVLKGANVMGIITNDGWWRNTAGYKQHLSYASLRAIETRRGIARSANTGISAFINQRGDLISQTGWDEEGALNGVLNLNEELTVFVKYGDITGRVSCFVFLLFLLMGFSRQISRKNIVKEAC